MLNIPQTPTPTPANAATLPVERVTAADTAAMMSYSPGSVDELADELRQPKQPFEVPDFEALETTVETPEPEPSPAEARAQNKMVAQTVASVGDGVLAFLLSVFAHDEPHEFRLPKESMRDIMPTLERCMAGKNIDLAPGWALFFAVLIAYLPLVMKANAKRNEWKEKQKAAEHGTASP
ncbi:MAG: hypothetical protein LBF90_03205 [Prevotellaceae bacterium]|jgi:hypothetical protein|nr:hypothetical protein [Prevotellaceae bacterium]